jgi:hypothetical protein
MSETPRIENQAAALDPAAIALRFADLSTQGFTIHSVLLDDPERPADPATETRVQKLQDEHEADNVVSTIVPRSVAEKVTNAGEALIPGKKVFALMVRGATAGTDKQTFDIQPAAKAKQPPEQQSA